MSPMIQITVKLAGRAAEAAGEESLEYGLVPPVRLGTLLELIGTRRPTLAAMLSECRITIREAIVDSETLLSQGDIVKIDAVEVSDAD